MATENQLKALEKWLIKELPAGSDICEMPGDVCSDALSRLHEASEAYKNDKTKKGIVLKAKQEIVSELRESGYIDLRIGIDQTLETEQKEKDKIDELHRVVFGKRAEEDQNQDKIREERVNVLEAEAREAVEKQQSAPELPKKPNEREIFGERVKAEAQRIREEQGLATTTIPIPPAKSDTAQPPTPPAKPTVAELIAKYTDILAQVTEAVNAESRIPEREKGYGIKFIYYSVKHALENGNKGGDHEE